MYHLFSHSPPFFSMRRLLLGFLQAPWWRLRRSPTAGRKPARVAVLDADDFTSSLWAHFAFSPWPAGHNFAVWFFGLPEFSRLLSFTFYLFPSPYLDNPAGDIPPLQHFHSKRFTYFSNISTFKIVLSFRGAFSFLLYYLRGVLGQVPRDWCSQPKGMILRSVAQHHFTCFLLFNYHSHR